MTAAMAVAVAEAGALESVLRSSILHLRLLLQTR